MQKTVSLLYFSPTGSTEKIIKQIGKSLSEKTREFDLSKQEITAHSFSKNDLVVIGVPVFSGRVPAKVIETISQFSGNSAHAVSVVVYGNRDFEDSLLELNSALLKQGFNVIASGAFIAQHSMINEIATGRPDKDDFEYAKKFATEILKKSLTSANSDISVPGNRPYKELKSSHVTPLVSDDCTKCGICVDACPLGAIPEEDPFQTDANRCILCMRCIYICAENARSLPKVFRSQIADYLTKVCAKRKENIMFI